MDPAGNSTNSGGGFDPSAVIVGGGYAIITVVGTIGNALVLFLVGTTEKLQNSSSVFIVNLGVADFLTCLVFSLVVLSRFAPYMPYLEIVCVISLSVAHTTVVVSIYTLASIAVNRLVLILSPMRYYLRVFTPRVFALWIGVLWFLALMVAVFPPLILDIGRLGYSQNFRICRSDDGHERSDLYDALMIFAVYPIPLIVIGVSYVSIFVRVFNHNRRMQQHSGIAMSSSSRTGVSDDESTAAAPAIPDKASKEERRRFLVQLRITKNMFIIFMAFFLCLTPHAICNFTECPLEAYTRLIVSTNSMLNPFIYGIGHPHFREAFGKLFKRKRVLVK